MFCSGGCVAGFTIYSPNKKKQPIFRYQLKSASIPKNINLFVEKTEHRSD
jgi:hypothetical protein